MSSQELSKIISLQTTSSSGTQLVFAVSGTSLLIIGWAICLILVAVGHQKQNKLLFASGIVGIGLMTLITPLTFYVYEAARLGGFEASPLDFLIVSFFAFLGGFIVHLGVTAFSIRKRGVVTPAKNP